MIMSMAEAGVGVSLGSTPVMIRAGAKALKSMYDAYTHVDPMTAAFTTVLQDRIIRLSTQRMKTQRMKQTVIQTSKQTSRRAWQSRKRGVSCASGTTKLGVATPSPLNFSLLS